MRTKRFSLGLRAILVVFTVALFMTSAWAASHETVLHAFNPNGTDGANPYFGSLISDAAGNLFGTTGEGGTYGVGTVFELTPAGGGSWTEKVLHTFSSNGADGTLPYSGLIFDDAGNLYGTTYKGGIDSQGTVYELSPNGGGGWTEKILHSFGNGNGPQGAYPYAGLVFDASGNLYGTTTMGGAHAAGSVFELTPDGGGNWTQKVLYSFDFNGTGGAIPQAGLILDAAGNLYGAAGAGGLHGYGNVFELVPAEGGGWTEKVLHSFGHGTDGIDPGTAGVVFDGAGNLYGAAGAGGIHGFGIVFELSPSEGGRWSEKVLYNFDGVDGSGPRGVLFDGAGNLYSTTAGGGAHDAGLAFELMPNGTGGWTEKVLHSFGRGKDGVYPYAGLMLNSAGHLYGTTYQGGTYGGGTVFELTPNGGGSWTEKPLYSFDTYGSDGAVLDGSLIFDAAGNLYGTTYQGGIYNYGAVFELTPAQDGGWTETVLHSFDWDGADGANPQGGLIFDAAGNLYGTTSRGGIHGSGTVFELSSTGSGGWTEKVLHSFQFNGPDGMYPLGGLVLDAAGNFYGTTEEGGIHPCGGVGCGTVFELSPRQGGGWTERVLHSFGRGLDGAFPVAGLISDFAGNLYGTTYSGGNHFYGTVFELSPQVGGSWTEKVLRNFNGTDGGYPYGGLTFDRAGNLYGTTYGGGIHTCGGYGCGTVFQLSPQQSGNWVEKVLHSFGGVNDGTYTESGVIIDAAGNLFGTTTEGGIHNYGTVFELTPEQGGTFTERVLHSFQFNGTDGITPYAGLILDGAGNLYGTASKGGSFNSGTVFEITF